MAAPLAAEGGIGLDDVAIVVFFVIVAVLRLLKMLRDRAAPGAPPGPGRPPRAPAPDPDEEPEQDEEDEEAEAARRLPPSRAPSRPAPPPRPAPKAAHLANLRGIARGERADLKRREAEPPPRLAGPPAGRELLHAVSLPPKDRVRQAFVWSEILRRPRPLRAPPRRR